MDIKKRMGLYIGLFLLSLSILNYISRGSDNYIQISNDRERVDFFNKAQEELSLYKKSDNFLEEIRLVPYLDGYLGLNTQIGEYTLEVKERGSLIKDYDITKKTEPFHLDLKHIAKNDYKKNSLFLNSLTGVFLIYNLSLIHNFKKEILKKKELIAPIFLLCLKILLTNSEVFTNTVMNRFNLLVTSALGLYLLLYVKNKAYHLRDEKFINLLLKVLFTFYFFGEIVVNATILNPKILNYLLINNSLVLKVAIFSYIWIDAVVIILLIFLFTLIKVEKRQIIKEIEKKNMFMIGSFIILSIVVEFFINNNKYFYYLNMFEFTFIFWYIFLMDMNTIGKINILKLKTFQMFLHVYIFFVMTESVWIALGVIGSFAILNIFTYFIQGTLRVDKSYIENLVNRMYLTKNYTEFKEQLSRELKKNLELLDVDTKILIKRSDYKEFIVDREYDDSEVLLEKTDILDKKYDYAVRLKYNKNPFIALILIENKNSKLVYEEKRYLEEISEKISIVASRYRIEKLQEELS